MPDKSQTIAMTIEHSNQRQFVRVPFTVEPDMELLTVSYAYQRRRPVDEAPGRERLDEVNIIDLGLEDPDHVLVGASGSERSTVLVHENYATPGYRPASLREGTWYVVLGLYLIEEGGCALTLTITQTIKQPVLLKGDTHLHTTHSDGWYSVEETIARARQDRLDYIFITDHNCMTSNASLINYPDIAVLPGVEVTYYDGHYNLLGVQRPVKTFYANTREEVLAIMQEGRQNGALSSINHPMDIPCGWKFGLGEDVPMDLMEIWNGPYTPENDAAVRFWHGELCKGRRLPVIGGSDAHRGELFRQMATPATFLYSRSRSKSDILEAIQKGHAFVGMTPDAPQMELVLGSARMGDIAVHEDGDMLNMTFRQLRSGDEIRLYDQTGVIFQDVPGRLHCFEAQRCVKGSQFVRAEIWRTLPVGGMTLASIGNPIYLR